ncbi:RagB/SusD family nutrient uptake outer membrane protein [Mucilaginibacter sabulilitoris]|uniref:RagB/SusD family nutrient uptake outer membrane protein n=1 Tax=Mucilaginibacter sabulilitoris TaxID=1173583 RepID=A0ABZ0TV86_9SPHI|nr:RagB/SusD family nutrient uptake outer membrane protein [Mucilaginibacter sabulilitoris]WPU97020.1 RagB/SusD family nutrient uptake outer membrane protein [Mucilaginibacter sabulilitoris]
MKSKHIYLFLSASLLIVTSGCKKFLEQPVLGQYQSDNFFTSDANAVLAVNAAYSPLTFTDASSNAIWVLGDLASDDAVKGSSDGDQSDFLSVQNFNINPSNAAVEAVWKRYYDGIFKCNVVTDGLAAAKTGVSEPVRNAALGQAEFLRAYYYFNLTVAYGDIPLHLKVESPEELQSPALPQVQIYAQIEKDCQAAATVLPASWKDGDAGRVTKGAALALLAKTYLFEKKWALAASTAAQVEALGVYSLLPVFSDNFRAATKINSEAVFSILHTTGLSPFQGNTLNQWFAPRTLNGYGFYLPTQSLVSNFEKSTAGVDDPRLDYSVGRAGHPYYDSAFDSNWTSTGYVSKKHTQPLAEIPVSTKGDGNLNYQAIRFAEVLLIKAEALNESGNGAGALIPLNKVRKRARESYIHDTALSAITNGKVPDGLLPDITTTDQATLRDAIRRERRSELALEFHRFFDIIRYGSAYAASVLNNKPNFNFTANQFFPIPESERQTNLKLGK